MEAIDAANRIFNWHRRCLKTSDVFHPGTSTWYRRPVIDLLRELQQHYYCKIQKCQVVLKAYQSLYQL